MNLVNEIKDIKYNYKPNVITLKISKKINNSIDTDIDYSTKNKYILASTTNLKTKENKTRWQLRRHKKILTKTKSTTTSLKK